MLNLGKSCGLNLLAEIKVNTSKNYKTCKRIHKLWCINQTDQSRTRRETVSKLKSMEIEGLEQTSTKFIYLCNNNFFTGRKPVVETISVTINGSSDVLYFNLYLINIPQNL